MAVSLSVTIDLSGFKAIEGVIQRAISIFIGKVAQAMLEAMRKVMPYNRRPSRRGKPPFSKTGRLVMSFRSVHRGQKATIYGEDYGRTLVKDLDRDYITAAWRLVQPRLQSLLNEAVREAQR